MNVNLRICLIVYLVLIVSNLYSSTNLKKKSIKAIKISENIIVDGILNEIPWKDTPIATDFIQIDPDNGKPANYKTEVKFLYDNTSLYIGAVLYDTEPNKINKNLSKRDDLENNDFFLVIIDPFNNGLDAVEFIVSPPNVQLDAKIVNNEDFSWDAVWKSATKITKDGWIVEMEIPYSSLRIPNRDVQKWGINIIRNIQRDREKVSWNFIDKKISGFLNQSGELTGLKDLQPPLRLSFTPYTSFYVNKDTENKWSTSLKGGMDMKLGIGKSHTLDMILIPDFEQVKSDDQVLNLSPFEIKFDEKRQFFTEGTEIFNRGNIFYSRRIGNIPRNYYDVEDQLNENEEISENPIKNKILNATKLSGRSSKGLGIGFLNAITSKSIATVTDTITQNTREIVTQPFTNYNLIVLDKSLKNESYISFLNSNLFSPEDDYLANVIGTDIYLKNKSKTYGYYIKSILSRRHPVDEDKETGYSHELRFEKLKGQYRYGFSHNLISDKYNPNDLGYLSKNNYINFYSWLRYDMSNPNKIYDRKNFYLRLYNEYQYNPIRYAEFTLYSEINYTLKSQLGFGFWSVLKPIKKIDYLEPRVDGKKYNIPPLFLIGGWFGTDYRKDFRVVFVYEFEKKLSSDNQIKNYFRLNTRYRFSDRLTFSGLNIIRHEKRFGYVDDETINNTDIVYFGRRKNLVFDNIFTTDYILNSKMYLSFRMRHYLSDVKYRRFYTLNDDGNLSTSDYVENHDQVYNAFNIDGNFTWRFAPGSDISFVWKNSLNASEEYSRPSYIANLDDILSMDRASSFSIRVIYYLDYLKLRKK